MKGLYLLGFVGLLAGALAGCPIFSGDGSGGTQTCVGLCSGGCGSPSDCGQNETCGFDGQCHPGDCTIPSTGCVAGYTCQVDANTQTASCVPSSTGVGGHGTGGMGTAGSTGTTTSTTTSTTSTTTTSTTTAPIYCGHPADCASASICGKDGTCHAGPCNNTNPCIYGYNCQSDGTCQSPVPNACDSDANCASGSLCIAGADNKGGICTAPADQCFDGNQCQAGEKCVAGKCELGCATTADCRDGFSCDPMRLICSVPAKQCVITNDCGGPTQVCVAGSCVPRSTNGTCPTTGDVWTENGCVPNQQATFNCTMEGQMGSGTGTPGVSCAAGSICLHRDCWFSCDPPATNACNGQPILNTCHSVVSSSMTYNICGTSQSLGNQCGAGTQGLSCTGTFICIDGYCK
jgi:hypothetical protein